VRRSEAKHNRRIPPPQRQLLTREINRVPLLPRPLYPVWTSHPLPIDIGEVSKLCAVEQGEVMRNPEAPTTLGSWPVVITVQSDHHCSASASGCESSFSELDGSVGRLLRSVMDLCIERLLPTHSRSCSLFRSHPAEGPRGQLSDYETDVLVRFSDVCHKGL
jgi:hypothetical protein